MPIVKIVNTLNLEHDFAYTLPMGEIKFVLYTVPWQPIWK